MLPVAVIILAVAVLAHLGYTIIAKNRDSKTLGELASDNETAPALEAGLATIQTAVTEHMNQSNQQTQQHMAQSLQQSQDHLNQSLQQSQEHMNQTIKQSQTLMEEKFENLASKVLSEKSEQFANVNSESISQLLDPMKTQVKEFKDKVEKIHTEDTKQQAELKTIIEMLNQQNTQLSQDADNLSKALKGEHQTQGSWGEMQLESALQACGLQRDREYKVQPSFRTEDGVRRPDVVVMLPDSKSLIIDAKVSLAAYSRYVSAEDDAEAQIELDAHVKAMKDRVDELAEREYESLPGLGSPQAVFLFTPLEAALQAALTHRPEFLTESLAKKVFIVSPSTIIPALTIVAQLWQLADQERNTEEIFAQASAIYDKAVGFVESMEKIGRGLETASKSYDEAMTRLVSGKGNLIKRADGLIELGADSKKSFPDEIQAKAELGTAMPAEQIEVVSSYENTETSTQ